MENSDEEGGKMIDRHTVLWGIMAGPQVGGAVYGWMKQEMSRGDKQVMEHGRGHQRDTE